MGGFDRSLKAGQVVQGRHGHSRRLWRRVCCRRAAFVLCRHRQQGLLRCYPLRVLRSCAPGCGRRNGAQRLVSSSVHYLTIPCFLVMATRLERLCVPLQPAGATRPAEQGTSICHAHCNIADQATTDAFPGKTTQGVANQNRQEGGARRLATHDGRLRFPSDADTGHRHADGERDEWRYDDASPADRVLLVEYLS